MRDGLKGEIKRFRKRLITTNKGLNPLTSFLHGFAISERISDIFWLTAARRYVINYFANRIDTTCSWARVLTSIPYTSSIGCTIGVNYALGSTAFIRVSVEIGQTSTGGRARNLAAHSIRAAW